MMLMEKQPITTEFDLNAMAYQRAKVFDAFLHDAVTEGKTSRSVRETIPAECLIVDQEYDIEMLAFPDWLSEEERVDIGYLWSTYNMLLTIESQSAIGIPYDRSRQLMFAANSEVKDLDFVRASSGSPDALNPLSPEYWQ